MVRLPHLLPVLLLLGAATAQAPHRLGVFLWHESPNDLTTLTGIKAGLTVAGVACEFVERHANGELDRACQQLDDLAGERCALVFVLGTQATLLAKQHLRSVPLVFAAVTNPVTAGIVADWGPSGSNLCGASNWIDPGNVLELFRLAVPDLRRLGMLRSRSNGVVSAAEKAATSALLARLGAPPIELVEEIAADADDLPRATAALLARHVDAIWVPIDLTVYSAIPTVQAALGASKVPLLTTAAAGVRAGATVGTIVDYRLHGRRAAALALQVLHGRAPGTLPIDRMHSSLVIVNLAAARRRHVELPLSILALADELIDAEGLHEPPR